jgi:hypothetical protein
MTKATLKPLLAAAVGATALYLTANAEPAQAFNITYSFTVNITSGTYTGNSYTGAFSYDNANLTNSGLEFVSPTAGNLGIQFNFLNKSFTQNQDRDASFDFPRVYFRNGNLLGLSFLVVPPTASPGFSFIAAETPNLQPGFYLGNTDAYNGTLVGSVLYNRQSDPGPGSGPCTGNSCPAVPEPPGIAGSVLAIGLFSLGLKLRKKHRSIQK